MPNGSDARFGAFVVDTSASPRARLKPVSIRSVKLVDGFWQPRRRINRDVTLPSQHRQLEETGRIDNFRLASGRKRGKFQGIFFNDSDVYKWIEAVSWTVASGGAPELARALDDVIGEVAAAQQEDGYLNTYFMFDRAKERWTNIRDMHEMYCAGHLIQAAVAHFRATGSTRLLDVARRLSDHVGSVFGPGKRLGACGHEEIEMALVELYRATRETRHLDLARFLVGARGKGAVGGSEYHQDHAPIREQDKVVGHAVRAMYFYSAGADLLAEDSDPGLRAALDKLWDNTTTRRMYVTGAVGARYEGEAFGRDYELPNERAYAETCAGIGLAYWAWRMLQLEGRAEYADVMERVLYNGILSGISLDGDKYFYPNPLENDGTYRREPWFGCACCPPNIARLLASLPGYLYGTSAEGLWVHLYAASAAELRLPSGERLVLSVKADYPWDGFVRIEIGRDLAETTEFSVFLRIPGWCAGARIAVNGSSAGADPRPGTYHEIRRIWRAGDAVELRLPMPVRTIESHPYLTENAGRVALARGPLVYCVEAVDHGFVDVRDLKLPRGTKLEASFRSDLLGGVTVLSGRITSRSPDPGWQGRLYRDAGGREEKCAARDVALVAIPYYSWANREPGRMRVWLGTE